GADLVRPFSAQRSITREKPQAPPPATRLGAPYIRANKFLQLAKLPPPSATPNQRRILQSPEENRVVPIGKNPDYPGSSVARPLPSPTGSGAILNLTRT